MKDQMLYIFVVPFYRVSKMYIIYVMIIESFVLFIIISHFSPPCFMSSSSIEFGCCCSCCIVAMYFSNDNSSSSFSLALFSFVSRIHLRSQCVHVAPCTDRQFEEITDHRLPNTRRSHNSLYCTVCLYIIHNCTLMPCALSMRTNDSRRVNNDSRH